MSTRAAAPSLRGLLLAGTGHVPLLWRDDDRTARRQRTQATQTPAADAELIRAVARRDTDALAVLYDRYAPLAYGIALRICRDHGRAEEVVSDAFLNVWRSARTYASGRGSVKVWLSAVVRNRALDERRRAPPPEVAFEEVDDRAGDPTAEVAAALDARAAMTSLSAQQRRVLELAYFEGLSRRQIASRLGLPLGTVKSLAWRGLEALRRKIRWE